MIFIRTKLEDNLWSVRAEAKQAMEGLALQEAVEESHDFDIVYLHYKNDYYCCSHVSNHRHNDNSVYLIFHWPCDPASWHQMLDGCF